MDVINVLLYVLRYIPGSMLIGKMRSGNCFRRKADGNKSVAVATVDAWRLAVGGVPPGGMV